MAKHSHPHQHPIGETRQLQLRLHKVIGQLQGVERMLLAERDCADVLTQLVSVRRGLKSLAEKVIQSHLTHCIAHASDSTEGRRNLEELATVLKRYVE